MRVKGTTGVLEQRRRFRTDAAGGDVLVRTWLGSPAAVQAFIDANRESLGDDWTTGPAGRAKVELVAVFAADQLQTVDGPVSYWWELNNNLHYRNLKGHPKWAAAETGEANATTRARYLALADEYVKTLDAELELTIGTDTYSMHSLPTWVNKYIELRMAGVDSYPFWQPVVRLTRLTSWRSQLRASWDGVGVVTSDSPVKELSGVVAKDAARPRFEVPSDYEWLKTAPSVHNVGRSRYSIDEEWWGLPKDGDQGWSEFLFEGGSGKP